MVDGNKKACGPDLHIRVLRPHIHDMLHDAEFTEDNNGQIVIYTGYREFEDSLIPVDAETEPLCTHNHSMSDPPSALKRKTYTVRLLKDVRYEAILEVIVVSLEPTAADAEEVAVHRVSDSDWNVSSTDDQIDVADVTEED